MKTYEIKDLLKKDLLIIELPEGCKFIMLNKSKVFQYETLLCDNTILKRLEHLRMPEGSYTLLGKPYEIREEDARELVKQSIHTGLFAHYVKGIPVNTYCYKTAKDSLLSALETVVFWENPIEEPFAPSCDCSECQGYFQEKQEEFEESESRTFDKSRTLIFVKK